MFNWLRVALWDIWWFMILISSLAKEQPICTGCRGTFFPHTFWNKALLIPINTQEPFGLKSALSRWIPFGFRGILALIRLVGWGAISILGRLSSSPPTPEPILTNQTPYPILTNPMLRYCPPLGILLSRRKSRLWVWLLTREEEIGLLLFGWKNPWVVLGAMNR